MSESSNNSTKVDNSLEEYDGGGNKGIDYFGLDYMFDRTPRMLPNGEIALPFSVCYVLKSLYGFDHMRCTVNASVTMILRIKFGDENFYNTRFGDLKVGSLKDQLLNYLENRLVIKINEEEHRLNAGYK